MYFKENSGRLRSRSLRFWSAAHFAMLARLRRMALIIAHDYTSNYQKINKQNKNKNEKNRGQILTPFQYLPRKGYFDT